MSISVIEPDKPEAAAEILRSDGYVIVSGVILTAEVQAAKVRLRYIAKHAKFYTQFGVHFVPGKNPPQSDDPLHQFDQISHVLWRDRELWERILVHPNMIRVASAIVGDSFNVINAGIFVKRPGDGSAVPWHQDTATWGVPPGAWGPDDAPKILDYWLALDHATEENGYLQLLPGSHLQGVVPHRDGGGLLHEADPRKFGFDIANAIGCTTAPGDLVIWHPDLFHGSDTNRSALPRLAAAGTFISSDEAPRLRKYLPQLQTLERLPAVVDGRPCALPNPIPARASGLLTFRRGLRKRIRQLLGRR